MKDRIIVSLVFIFLVILPCFAQTGSGESGRIPEFISAMTKKGAAKIAALNAYVKKYPEPEQKWTKLAFYNLAVAYFQAGKYKDTVTAGEHTLKIGTSAKAEEARLYLIISNSYAVKSAPVYNQGKALSYANKAISCAKKNNLRDVLKKAEDLKSKLGTKKVSLPIDKQILRAYTEGDFDTVISLYKKLPQDKRTGDLPKVHALSLLKSGKTDRAVNEFNALLTSTGDPFYAAKLASAYGQKASRNRSLRDKAALYYLKAHVLYAKKRENGKSDSALKNARFQLNQKHKVPELIKAVNIESKGKARSKEKQEALVRKLRRSLHELKKKKRREFGDIAPPKWFTDQYEKAEQDLANAQSGGGASAATSKSFPLLEKARQQVEDDLKRMLAEAKK